jgi:RNA polymerase sigma factor (sigma-70 family)
MDDLQLAKAVRAGDPAAEELFFRRYQPRLYKAAAYFLGPRDPDAEDVVQQALLIAFQKLDSYDPKRASLYTWMARICVNLCYQRLDKRRREQATAWEELEAALEPQAQARRSAQDEAGRKEALLALLREGLKRLGEACTRILRLRDQQGLSYAQVGRELKVPIGTVMSRLARCRRQLKDWVQAQGEGGGHA